MVTLIIFLGMLNWMVVNPIGSFVALSYGYAVGAAMLILTVKAACVCWIVGVVAWFHVKHWWSVHRG